MWKLRERYSGIRYLLFKVRKLKKILKSFPSQVVVRLSDREKRLIQRRLRELVDIAWWNWVPPRDENSLSQDQVEHLNQQVKRLQSTLEWFTNREYSLMNNSFFDMKDFKKTIKKLIRSLVRGERFDGVNICF